jgi:S-adenosyl-L-methionine hydrolase (adenosine-forming)
MPNPVITLTTDLGHSDYYVGVLKGVILRIHPTIKIVDLCHEVNPFDIVEAAFKLECSYRYFPLMSIHVVVVDPGVGSTRRPLLAVGENFYYLAPDNGVLSWVIASDNVQHVYAIDATHYFLEKVSKTFHGRDVFAPCAAHLAKILDSANFGEEITDYKLFKLPVAEMVGEKQISGKIISIDRFGNCISTISEELLAKLQEKADPGKLIVKTGDATIHGLNDYYAQKESRDPIALVGNAGYLEVAINKGNAARDLKIRKNQDITVSAP